jgi:spore germination cell wall hydrolase CwlJ-like protein
MQIFNQTKRFTYRRWGEGFALGALFMMTTAAAMPPKIVEVEKVVEKPIVTVEKVPVYVTDHDKQQINCMAENAYFEAVGEPIKGVIAVNNVVMNRVEDKRFPNSPCGVINQRTKRVCQFSWKCEGGKRIRDWDKYKQIKEVTESVYLGNTKDVTKGAQFYHADYVSPSWSRVFNRTTKIGAHIFYRG